MDKQTDTKQDAGVSQSASSKLLCADFAEWYGQNIDPMFEPGKQLVFAQEIWNGAIEHYATKLRKYAAKERAQSSGEMNAREWAATCLECFAEDIESA